MTKYLVLIIFLLFAKLTTAQLTSSYTMKLIAVAESYVFKSQFNADSDKIFYLSNSSEKSQLFEFDLLNDSINHISDFKSLVLDFEVHPVTKNFLIVANDTSYQLIDNAGNQLKESKLNNRNAKFLQPVFNSNGNLLAFLGKTNPKDAFSMMTYDFKYDNLNQHFKHSENAHEPDWSPKSDYLSYHEFNPINNTSLIQIVGWDGRPLFQIKSDTVKLSNANWGVSSTKFLCVAVNDYFYYIFVLRTDGQHVETVLKSKFPLSDPDWSPDGKKISVTVSPLDGLKQLWIIDLEKNTN